MPQIWMTYDELAGLLDCGVLQARERVQQEGLDRKKSRDGNTRVKLNFALMAMFIAKIKGEFNPLDRAIQDIREVHAQMKGYEDRQAQLEDLRAKDEPAALAG